MASYSDLVVEQLLAPEQEPDLKRIQVSSEQCDFGFFFFQMAVVGTHFPEEKSSLNGRLGVKCSVCWLWVQLMELVLS